MLAEGRPLLVSEQLRRRARFPHVCRHTASSLERVALEERLFQSRSERAALRSGGK